MSFRLFIYYSALLGGAAALAGWGLGRWLATSPDILGQGIKAMFLGMAVALALGLVDALWNLSLRQPGQILVRVIVAAVVGSIGGLMGGMLSQWLFNRQAVAWFLVLGWMLTGMLIGAAPGSFELISGWIAGAGGRGPGRKVRNGILGGAVGGAMGGGISLILHEQWGQFLSEKPAHLLWSPSALGFLALGICLGLLIGMAQVFLKEAWLRVVQGLKPGREVILSKPHLTIGRSESCDIGLFGDNNVERVHAYLHQDGNAYLLLDAGSPAGTYVNGARVTEPCPLHSGDLIQVGSHLLSFGERRK